MNLERCKRCHALLPVETLRTRVGGLILSYVRCYRCRVVTFVRGARAA